MMGALTLSAIEVTPTYQIFTIKPGKKAAGEFTLMNNEGEDVTVKLSAKDWFVMTGNEKFKATDWLTFQEKEIPIEKGASKVVKFFVESPKGAQGELVGMVSFNIVGQTESNVQKILSVAIYSAAQGTEKLKGEVRAFRVVPSSRTVEVSALLINEGNVHIRPSGWFRIENDKNFTVANIAMTPGRPVYPGKEEVYSGSVKDFTLRPGNYKLFITLTDVDRQKAVVDVSKKFVVKEDNTVELR